MESCKLEIVLHSAVDLLDVKVFGTMDPYAMLWITNSYGGLSSVQYKISVAQNAGCNPVWNSSMQFEVGSMTNSYNLFCEINHDGTLFDRKIGEVRVPFTNLLAGNAFGEKVSYPLKLDTGEVVGKIILSHKFSNPAVMSSGANNTSKVSGTPGAKDTNKVSAKSGANNTDKVSSTSGAKNTSKVSGTTGAKNTSKVSDTSGAKNTNKVSGTSGAKNTSKVSAGTSGAKNTSKVSADTSGTKNRKPRKKFQGKENGGLAKNIAMDVGTGALLLAGTAGITLAGLDMLHDEDENLAEYEDVDVGINVDVDVDVDVDEDEDEDEDADEDVDVDVDVDVDACEYEDEEGDDDDEDDDVDEDSYSDSDSDSD
ncbi:uncharacterized protein LOC143566998 [Bidens hawaiensis]|uniref:uncharacterized protein LOC143566998 n=1 Tax=Bidens hawaiensis TaxID=980011 RepID=UPI004048ECD7